MPLQDIGVREEESETPNLPMGAAPKQDDIPMIRVDEGSSGSFRFGPSSRSRTDERPTPYPHPFSAGPPSLPQPPGHSTYLEIKDFDRDEDLQQLGIRGSFIGATWRYDRE